MTMNWIRTLDKPRTVEWQLGLSNDVMHKAWAAWVVWKRAQEEEGDEKATREAFGVAMRNCYGQVMENDVFFSGMEAAKKI